MYLFLKWTNSFGHSPIFYVFHVLGNIFKYVRRVVGGRLHLHAWLCMLSQVCVWERFRAHSATLKNEMWRVHPQQPKSKLHLPLQPLLNPWFLSPPFLQIFISDFSSLSTVWLSVLVPLHACFFVQHLQIQWFRHTQINLSNGLAFYSLAAHISCPKLCKS